MKTSADFLLSGRSFSHWITGIAFMSANLGALEVMGMWRTAQVWHADQSLVLDRRHSRQWSSSACSWCAFTIPMEFAACRNIFGMRFDHRAHLLSSLSFSVVTVLMAGIDMYAFAIIFKSMFDWPFAAQRLPGGSVVYLFVFWGGLSSSIYNECSNSF